MNVLVAFGLMAIQTANGLFVRSFDRLNGVYRLCNRQTGTHSLSRPPTPEIGIILLFQQKSRLNHDAMLQ